LAAYI